MFTILKNFYDEEDIERIFIEDDLEVFMSQNPTSPDWWEEEIIKNTTRWYHRLPILDRVYAIYRSYYTDFYNEGLGIVNEMNNEGKIDDKTQDHMKQVLFVNMEERIKYNNYALAKDRLNKCCQKLASIYESQT